MATKYLQGSKALAVLLIVVVAGVSVFSNSTITGAVALTATPSEIELGFYSTSLKAEFDKEYSKVTKVEVSATIGGKFCSPTTSRASIRNAQDVKVGEIILPATGAGGTAKASKNFLSGIKVKKIIVEDAGGPGTCNYVDDINAKITYINDPPTIVSFEATPIKGMGDTFVNFEATVQDSERDKLELTLYFDVNDISAATTKTLSASPQLEENQAILELGGFSYAEPLEGSTTYTARLKISDGKNPAVTKDVQITISAGDKTPPVVTVSHSPERPLTDEVVTITAAASDNIGVSSIEIYVDNNLVKTCEAISVCVYTTGYNSPGAHTYYAIAKDTASSPNTGRSITGIFNVIQYYALTVTKLGTGIGTVTSAPEGINCGTNCVTKLESGTKVTLTAKPDEYSTFEGWGGDCASAGKTNSCTIAMNNRKVVSATFEEIPCTWGPQTSGTDYSTNNFQSVYFTDSNTGWAVGEGGTILKTTDGGNKWKPQTSGTGNNLYSVHFTDSNTGWAVGGGGTILKTTDGGTKWKPQTSGTHYSSLLSVYFTDSNTGWVVGTNGLILKTTDGGNIWGRQFGDVYYSLLSVYFTDSNTGWVVGDGETILKTTDGGAKWEIRPSGTDHWLWSVYFTDSNTGWAVGDGGTILKTTDGGNKWKPQTSGIHYPSFPSVHFTDSNTGWVVGTNGLILKTTDGGNIWETKTSGTNIWLLSVYFTDSNTGWAVGGGGTILKCSVPPAGGRGATQPSLKCTDVDNDGYGQEGTNLVGCISSTTIADCNDNNVAVNPRVGEICNGVDDNCNGQKDEGLSFFDYEAYNIGPDGTAPSADDTLYGSLPEDAKKNTGVCEVAGYNSYVTCSGGQWYWDYAKTAAQVGWVYETEEGKASANNCNDGHDNDCDGKLDCGTLQNCSPLTWASDGERSNGYCNTFCDNLAQQTCGQVGGSQGQGQGASQAGGQGE